MGENGSGKSAIMKIISGIFQPDSGKIILEGMPVHFKSVHDSKKHGIHYVMQDTNLYENLSVAENVFFDKMPYIHNFFKLIDINKMYYDCQILFDKLNMTLIHKTVSQLGFAQKQLVELAKACISFKNTHSRRTFCCTYESEEKFYLKLSSLSKKRVWQYFIYLTNWLKLIRSVIA